MLQVIKYYGNIYIYKLIPRGRWYWQWITFPPVILQSGDKAQGNKRWAVLCNGSLGLGRLQESGIALTSCGPSRPCLTLPGSNTKPNCFWQPENRYTGAKEFCEPQTSHEDSCQWLEAVARLAIDSCSMGASFCSISLWKGDGFWKNVRGILCLFMYVFFLHDNLVFETECIIGFADIKMWLTFVPHILSTFWFCFSYIKNK